MNRNAKCYVLMYGGNFLLVVVYFVEDINPFNFLSVSAAVVVLVFVN